MNHNDVKVKEKKYFFALIRVGDKLEWPRRENRSFNCILLTVKIFSVEHCKVKT